MSTTAQLLEAVQTIQASQKAINDRLDAITQPPVAGTELARNVGPFHIRKGEDPNTSRGFSFLKLFGVMAKQIEAEDAKVELQLCEKIRRSYDSVGYVRAQPGAVMCPLGSEFMAVSRENAGLAKEVRDVTKAAMVGFDPHEFLAYAKASGNSHMITRALSWVDESQGGSLVGPPLMGELIELLRNNEIFMQAGAKSMAMPPNGRITYPRQTTAGSAYWVGESATITDSTPNTGDVILTAKKLGILVKVPNELFRFATVNAEMFLREDISRVLALKLDKTLLEDVGSATTPKGLINYANINKFTSTDPGTTTNGYTLQPEDIPQFIATVEEQNAIFKTFIMRPLEWAAIVNRRADAVTAGDKKGPFVFNIWRELSHSFDLGRQAPGNLYGYPVLKSTQVSNARARGAASNLTYILGGDFNDYIVALSGAVEFMVSTQGDTPFTTDQTWFRGIMYCDGAPRHEASFALMDQLVVG